MIKVVKPCVELIAYTTAIPSKLTSATGMEIDLESSSAEDLMEFAGRACYQSFHKPNPTTRSNKDYLANIIRSGHGSVLEHSSGTFYLTGVSRALTHELIRHRHLSFSQLSQRFVDGSDTAIVLPPAIKEGSEEHVLLDHSVHVAVSAYEDLVSMLQEEQGLKRKQAREAARAVLPNCVETRIVVTGNLRAWRDVLQRRLDPAADAEIRMVSQMIYEQLNDWAGNALQDFEEDFE